MIRKITSMLAAFAIALATLAPAAADARDRRGYYGHHGDYYGRRHDHDGDAVAAGVIGLVLGLAIGSAASQPPPPRYGCYDRCRPPPPPPRCYDPCGRESYYDPYYDDRRYDDPRARYERDYGYGPEGAYYGEPECTRTERQWDRYARRYVVVDVPC